MAQPLPAALEALATLTAPGEVLYLDQDTCDPLPSCWALEAEKAMPQMVLERPAETPAPGVTPVVLGPADVPAMCALANLTHPGPFGPEMIKLGGFLGVKENGRLLAMAGRRFRLPGFVEISGVCPHPDAQGRGYARALMNHLARDLQRAGDIPFLHVIEENTRAAGLYARMGFVPRKQLWGRVVRCVG